MGPIEWIVTYGCKLGLKMLFRIDASEMKKIRAEGPLIVYTNHRSLVEGPLVYTFLKPRKKVTGLSKVENWKNPFMGFVFTLFGIIPLHRETNDMESMRAVLAALKDGFILGLAPEGTRSKTGRMQKAHEGVAFLALRSGSPLQPLANWDDRPLAGERGLPDEAPLRKGGFPLRRPVFDIRVGRAFRLDAKGRRVTREILQEMTDEIMYQLAKLLPEKFRGVYSDLGKATEKWLAFEG
jgi:1-acyl-sn-glycerol-3-phosphate acyltransferase